MKQQWQPAELINHWTDQQVQTVMRGSYSNHYRRMVPVLLKALDFGANSEASQPLLTAIGLLRKYAEKNQAAYPEKETVPLDGIVPEKWLPLVKQGNKVNRISYKLCVLRVVRDKMRCKELYTRGAYRYRNPDEDLPQDFAAKREEYFKDLELPLSADEFILAQQKQMKATLIMLTKGMPKNGKVNDHEKKREALDQGLAPRPAAGTQKSCRPEGRGRPAVGSHLSPGYPQGSRSPDRLHQPV